MQSNAPIGSDKGFNFKRILLYSNADLKHPFFPRISINLKMVLKNWLVYSFLFQINVISLIVSENIYFDSYDMLSSYMYNIYSNNVFASL